MFAQCSVYAMSTVRLQSVYPRFTIFDNQFLLLVLIDQISSDSKWAENDQFCQKLLAELTSIQDWLTFRIVAYMVGAMPGFSWGKARLGM